MPLYDYRCSECRREIEVMHGINDRGPETCESCGGTMRKALSPPAIHFKGSGWAKKDAAASAKASKPKTDSDKGSGKSDDKPKSGDGAKSDTSSTAGSGSESTSKPASTAGSKTD